MAPVSPDSICLDNVLVQLNQVGTLFAVEGKFAIGTFNGTLIIETVLCYEILKKHQLFMLKRFYVNHALQKYR